MPEDSEENCACADKKRINCEFEGYVHAGEVASSEKPREPTYKVHKRGTIMAENIILTRFS